MAEVRVRGGDDPIHRAFLDWLVFARQKLVMLVSPHSTRDVMDTVQSDGHSGRLRMVRRNTCPPSPTVQRSTGEQTVFRGLISRVPFRVVETDTGRKSAAYFCAVAYSRIFLRDPVRNLRLISAASEATVMYGGTIASTWSETKLASLLHFQIGTDFLVNLGNKWPPLSEQWLSSLGPHGPGRIVASRHCVYMGKVLKPHLEAAEVMEHIIQDRGFPGEVEKESRTHLTGGARQGLSLTFHRFFTNPYSVLHCTIRPLCV
jgi:hypothetical protein